MEVPVLKRQVAEKIEFCEIPMLRQFEIPPEIETAASPKPDELEPEPDVKIVVKIVDGIEYVEWYVEWNGIEYVEFNGHWYPSGPA
jgi:hypothetical protein